MALYHSISHPSESPVALFIMSQSKTADLETVLSHLNPYGSTYMDRRRLNWYQPSGVANLVPWGTSKAKNKWQFDLVILADILETFCIPTPMYMMQLARGISRWQDVWNVSHLWKASELFYRIIEISRRKIKLARKYPTSSVYLLSNVAK